MKPNKAPWAVRAAVLPPGRPAIVQRADLLQQLLGSQAHTGHGTWAGASMGRSVVPSSGGVPVAAMHTRPAWQLPPGFLPATFHPQQQQQPPGGGTVLPNLANLAGLQSIAGVCICTPLGQLGLFTCAASSPFDSIRQHLLCEVENGTQGPPVSAVLSCCDAQWPSCRVLDAPATALQAS